MMLNYVLRVFLSSQLSDEGTLEVGGHPKRPKPLGAADRQRWLILHVSTQGIELAGDQIDFLIE